MAREWNEQNLAAIRTAFPDPPVHARNLFHLSAAMYDAWAAYDPAAIGYAHNEWAEVPAGSTLAAARDEAVSYAAYRILVKRYFTTPHPNTPNDAATAAKAAFDAEMTALGYSPANTSTAGPSPAAVGNRVADTLLAFVASDDSRESQGYNDPTYFPVNSPLILSESGTELSDPNRWQPLAFDSRRTQNGIIADKVQSFVASHWGPVRSFALHLGEDEALAFDPGTPPLYGGEGEAQYKENNVEVIRFSSWLDPDDGVMKDISPGAYGNNSLGQNDGTGHAINPATGEAYESNLVKRGDFGRVMAEFWADGPASETPPGHWNTLANQVVDHPDFEPRLGGTGPLLEPLEWDVKMYFALNGALHDVAVAIWGCKRHYDYIRPISSIRFLGQNNELPLVPGLIEQVTVESTRPLERHAHLGFHIGKTAIYCWPGEPDNPASEHSGAEWILAEDWMPYQRSTFVTPAFAGYVSGHSGFSRSAAEVLTLMTGSPFFPGGMGSQTVTAGSLHFEYGPSEDITLQWGTYYDAADQAGISRLYGGIHVAPDDGPGRIMGSRCGLAAWELAKKYYNGTIATEEVPIQVVAREDGSMEISWNQHRGLFYTLYESTDLDEFVPVGGTERAGEDRRAHLVVAPAAGPRFFKVVRTVGP
ncbi:vanadium-dependent haloperoxidase [Roseibacillus ishigakijimensis]|uniref:Vanadium-dependent haloperoxidase n=1 Tax=Roseibacillus ishigakijimensis TaxID=454146 RepID=A0A934VNR1_9BACT|nr:vanadium-dependent haloperoxidase [Roseibacillus ishigakijimensis]MBK1835295.1 vanadium-dependent haloperoxidase [Roseibacillus ishigakijimensis]